MGGSPDPAGRAVCFEYPTYNYANCFNGTLMPGRITRIRDLTDGLSNVAVVGEQSGAMSGKDLRLNYRGGWSGWSAPHSPPDPANVYEGGYGAGIQTARYPINATDSICSHPSGCEVAWDMNSVLNSFHKGGTQLLLGDGSVRFAGDSINLGTYVKLCVRDDGQIVGEW